MPKFIGYSETGRASRMMGKGRSAKASNKNLKKSKRTKKTEAIIKRLRDAGMSEKKIKILLDKGAK